MSEATVPMLLGWTFQQWAIAAGRYGRPEMTFPGILALQTKWKLSCAAEPGEVTLAGVEVVMDYDAASAIVSKSPPDPWAGYYGEPRK